MIKPKTVTIRVPASTSNLGSGFDTLGLALKLYNTIRVTRISSKGVTLVSPMPVEERKTATAMALQAARAFFRRAQRDTFGMQVFLVSQIPVARGLGASATLRLGMIAALNELTQAQLDRQQLLDLATSLEGHPDNASPAIGGGFTVSGLIGKTVRCLRFSVRSDVKFVTLVPPLRISTETARRLVPNSFSKADTLHSLNRAALISAAFASSDYAALRGLFDDRVHQPYREKLLPELSRTIRAAEKAGAIGGWLSGSGSAIMCLTLDKAEVIANAMLGALPDSQVKILSPDNHGFQVMER